MPRRVLEGMVVSDKMDKSVVVEIQRYVKHPLYKKRIKRSKRYVAHDEHNQCKQGQTIKIVETRPISKRKSWAVLN